MRRNAPHRLVTRPASATCVAAGAAVPSPLTRQAAPPPPLIADFRWGVPDLSAFPMPNWLWAVREAARTMPSAALDYGDPLGSTVLREAIAASGLASAGEV